MPVLLTKRSRSSARDTPNTIPKLSRGGKGARWQTRMSPREEKRDKHGIELYTAIAPKIYSSRSRSQPMFFRKSYEVTLLYLFLRDLALFALFHGSFCNAVATTLSYLDLT